MLAVDLSPAFLELARSKVLEGDLADRVDVRPGRPAAPADHRGRLRPGLVRQSLYSLPDPVDALRRMERAARPGGIVAVFENDEFHHVLLPWPVEVELALRHAELAALIERSDQPRKFYIGRHLRRVFRAAGLVDGRHRTWTIDRQAPLGPDDRAFFEGYLQDLRQKVEPHLEPEIRDEFARLADPESDAYLLDSPDFTVTCLNHLAWCVKPGTDQQAKAGSRTRPAVRREATPRIRRARRLAGDRPRTPAWGCNHRGGFRTGRRCPDWNSRRRAGRITGSE